MLVRLTMWRTVASYEGMLLWRGRELLELLMLTLSAFSSSHCLLARSSLSRLLSLCMSDLAEKNHSNQHSSEPDPAPPLHQADNTLGSIDSLLTFMDFRPDFYIREDTLSILKMTEPRSRYISDSVTKSWQPIGSKFPTG